MRSNAVHAPTPTKMAPFLHRAKQEHLAFDYVADAFLQDLIYPTLSLELAQFFNQNGLTVPRNQYVNKLIELSEHHDSLPRLFEILICKQRGHQGRPGTLQIGMEDGLSMESLTYQKMTNISKRYCPDWSQIVIFIGMSLCIHKCVLINVHFIVPRVSVFIQVIDNMAHYCRSTFLYKGFTTFLLSESRDGPVECWPQCHPVCLSYFFSLLTAKIDFCPRLPLLNPPHLN